MRGPPGHFRGGCAPSHAQKLPAAVAAASPGLGRAGLHGRLRTWQLRSSYGKGHARERGGCGACVFDGQGTSMSSTSCRV